MFQSPSNRVKCSDGNYQRFMAETRTSFNPLVIGSSVLILIATTAFANETIRFNPLSRLQKVR